MWQCLLDVDVPSGFHNGISGDKLFEVNGERCLFGNVGVISYNFHV